MKQVWLNLPTKDLQKSKTFYSEIGFRENPKQKGSAQLGSFLIGEGDFVLMLFPEDTFKNYTLLPVANTSQTSQMLINIEMSSMEEVDALAERVWNAGGQVFFPPTEVEAWMYITSFADLDGHRWSALYMKPH